MRRAAGSATLCDRALYASDAVVLGEFACTTEYSNFATAGRGTTHVIAFPHNAVWIERSDTRRFVADPSLATLYNPGQEFQRSAISPTGDRSDWMRIPEATAREIVAHVAPRANEDVLLFRAARAAVSNPVFIAQRRLFNAARAGSPDRLRIDETAMGLADAVIRSAFEGAAHDPVHPKRALELAESAKAVLFTTLFENLGVFEIANRIGVSAFHLCRTFCEATGTTLHAHRRAVRLRVAGDMAAEHRGKLSSLAIETGFNSHSHFSAAFRREFGHAPSVVWSELH